jgi:radical SAM superfamily enzyme YgiQ (UPF0313 family)
MSDRRKLLLVYPRLGFVGSYVKNVPLSLVYAATEARKLPIDIEIIDLRFTKDWEPLLRQKLAEEPIIGVGVSVMSGIPILNALDVSRLAKRLSNAPVIWGGPHPTILPEEVLRCPEVDFVVRGFGAAALAGLVQKFLAGDRDYGGIPGLCYKDGGVPVIARINCAYELFDFRDLPYDLIEQNLEWYFEGMEERIFPIYSSVGCAYQCAFCIAPVWYRDNILKWVPLGRDEVVDHIAWLKEQYGITFIYFYDDDSFVDRRHFMSVAREIERRGISMKFGFRGLRANEIVRLSDDDLSLLERIGVKTVHIGAESGSPRMLALMKKGITVEQTIRANRMLARHHGITPIYNFLAGLPGETMEDLRKTKNLMLALVGDNPGAILVWPAKLIPYPGSELYGLALRHGFEPPADIAGWSRLDQELDIHVPWIPQENDRYIKMMQVTSYFIDDKDAYLGNCGWLVKWGYRLLRAIYRPLALWRLRRDRCGFLVEYRLFNIAKKLLQK